MLRKHSEPDPRLFCVVYLYLLPSLVCHCGKRVGVPDERVYDGLGPESTVKACGLVSVVGERGLHGLVFSPLPLPCSWRNRTAGTATNKLWFAALAFVTLVMYSVAAGGLILMAVFYTQEEGCLENKILLGLNGGLCLLVSVVAILPCIQNRKHGFFPSSLFICCCV